jgi:hypothetical protein
MAGGSAYPREVLFEHVVFERARFARQDFQRGKDAGGQGTELALERQRIGAARFDLCGLEGFIGLRYHLAGVPVDEFQLRPKVPAALFLNLLQQHLAEAQDLANGIVQIVACPAHAQAEFRIRNHRSGRGIVLGGEIGSH